jgi:regulator of protease activity HflC (stomatin/prohibitin superfamily)
MNAQTWFQLLLGVGAGVVGLFMVTRLLRGSIIEVEDEHVALVTVFGRQVARLDRPGMHVYPSRWLPWVDVHHVSLARDFRVFHNVHANDLRGTTVLADLWVELRVVDAEKALFAVEDWDKATMNLVVHAAMSILGSRDFQQILDDRSELGAQLQRDVSAETERWGVKVEHAFVRNVSLLPEVSRQVFGTVAARLERARAVVEELGRLDAARLEAETSGRVAALVADAKGQYPLAVGRAMDELGKQPAVLAAYNELYALAQVRGSRTVAFRGFDGQQLRAVDAAMLPDSAATPAPSPRGNHPINGEPSSTM